MENKELKQNVRLGTFVLAGVILFLIAVVFIGSASNFFSKTFTVSAIFKNIEGLKAGDKVWLSGVQIGTVKAVKIVKEGSVVVNLSLKEKQNEFIRKNATAFIGSDGLVGNKIVVIRPGDSPQVIQDADTINAASPADTQELLNIAKEVGENTRSITDDLKMISAKVKNGKGIVGELLNDGPLSQQIRETVLSLKTTGENASKASSELSSLAYEMKHGNGLMHALISDTSYTHTFSEVLIDVKNVSANAKAMSQSLQEITTRMKDKDNAIGVLLADTAMANNLKKTIVNAEAASKKLDQNMEALKHNFLTRGYFRKEAKKEEKEKNKK